MNRSQPPPLRWWRCVALTLLLLLGLAAPATTLAAPGPKVVTTKVVTMTGHTDDITCLAFDRKGHFLASGSKDSTVRIWSVKSGKTVRVLRGHRAQLWDCRYGPRDKVLVTTSYDNSAKFWSAKTGKLLRTLKKRHVRYRQLAISRRLIAIGSSVDRVKLYRLKNSGRPKRRFKVYPRKVDASINGLSFSPNGKLLAVATDPARKKLSFRNPPRSPWFYENPLSKVTLWNPRNGRRVKVLGDHEWATTSISFHPGGKLLASSGTLGDVKIWNVKTGKLVRTLQGRRDPGVLFSAGGTALAIWRNFGRFNTLELWSVKTWKKLRTLARTKRTIDAVAFSPDQRTVVWGGNSKKIHVWRSNKKL